MKKIIGYSKSTHKKAERIGDDIVVEGIVVGKFYGGMLFSIRDNYKQLLGSREFPDRYKVHECLTCGQYFLSHVNSGLCSDECRNKRKTNVAGVKRANERHAALASTTCSICGASVNPDRKTRAYCSNACRQKAHRNSIREKLALLDTLLAKQADIK